MDNQLLPASPTYTIKQQVETFQLLPASPTYTIKQQVESLWIQGIKLKHILQNAEIFVYLLNALIPLLKEPKRFSKLLNKVKRQQKVTLKTKMRKKISKLLVRKNVCELHLLTNALLRQQ